MGELAEADHGGGFDVPAGEPAVALHHDHAVGGAVADGDGAAGQDGEFLGAVGGGAVADPVFDVAPGLHLGARPDRARAHEVVVAEVRVDVGLPVDHLHQPVDVAHAVGRGVLPQQRLGHHGVAGERLVHGEHVGGGLGLVGAQAAWGVEDAGRDVPAGADLEPIGL